MFWFAPPREASCRQDLLICTWQSTDFYVFNSSFVGIREFFAPAGRSSTVSGIPHGDNRENRRTEDAGTHRNDSFRVEVQARFEERRPQAACSHGAPTPPDHASARKCARRSANSRATGPLTVKFCSACPQRSSAVSGLRERKARWRPGAHAYNQSPLWIPLGWMLSSVVTSTDQGLALPDPSGSKRTCVPPAPFDTNRK